MLIDCQECASKISDQARACPSCGAPIGRSSEPSMAGSWMAGAAGAVMHCFGVILLLLSLFGLAMGGPDAPGWLLISLALLAGGSYAKYSSQHSIRIVR